MGQLFIKSVMASKEKKLLLIILMLCGFPANAETYINEIHFEGNIETRNEVMLREIFISEGDELDGNKILNSVQAIMDLGLFRSVDYYLQDAVDSDDEN